MTEATTEASIDGRTARRRRNRDAVLDAALELFAEGSLEPGPAEVAERSGVSLRSVYRYFDDSEALLRAAIARNLERRRPLFEIDGLGEGPLSDRVERMVAGRLRLHRGIAPMMRATLRRAPTNRIIRDQLAANLEEMRVQVEQMFAPELRALSPADRREVAAALDVLVGFHSIEHLRVTRSLSTAETRRTLERAVTAVLVSDA